MGDNGQRHFGKEENGVSINVLDVINGQGGSIENDDGRWKFAPKTWTDIELDAEFVQGLVDGTHYGIAIWTTHDDIGYRICCQGTRSAQLPNRNEGLTRTRGNTSQRLLLNQVGFSQWTHKGNWHQRGEI